MSTRSVRSSRFWKTSYKKYYTYDRTILSTSDWLSLFSTSSYSWVSLKISWSNRKTIYVVIDIKTDHMFVNNEIKCVILSQTTLTNASFRNMIFTGSTFIETRLTNSDFSSSRAYGSLCNGDNEIGVNFMDAVLDGSTFDGAWYRKSSFYRASLNGARMLELYFCERKN